MFAAATWASGPPRLRVILATPCSGRGSVARQLGRVRAAVGDEEKNVSGVLSPPASVESLVEQVGSAWDPEGLLPPMDKTPVDHFKRRAALNPKSQAAQATGLVLTVGSTPGPTPTNSKAVAPAPAPVTPLPFPTPAAPSLPQPGAPGLPDVRRVPAEALAEGGLTSTALSPQERDELELRLGRDYMTVDLNTPGLRILNLEPPIFTVDNFYPDKDCDALVAAAASSGRMELSKVGAGNVSSSSSNQYHSRRNSSGMMVDNETMALHPRLGKLISDSQSRGRALLQAKRWRAWGKPGRMPNPGQYTYESAQVTRYETGQHFLAHEDAFPRGLAEVNGFNRAATLLLYLNDVPQGGSTRFEKLDLAVAPRKGKLLVFFPSLADGTPDSRTLHTGEDAEDTTKHVIQQWVACGHGSLPAAAAKARLDPSFFLSTSSDNAQQNTAGTPTTKPVAVGAGRSFSIPIPVAASVAASPTESKKVKKTAKSKKGFGKK